MYVCKNRFCFLVIPKQSLLDDAFVCFPGVGATYYYSVQLYTYWSRPGSVAVVVYRSVSGVGPCFGFSDSDSDLDLDLDLDLFYLFGFGHSFQIRSR